MALQEGEKQRMNRYRFYTDSEDYRSITFPPPGPYWCSGYDADDRAVIVAYVPNIEAIMINWPEAAEIDVLQENVEITFTDRFPKPDYWP